MLIYIVHRLVQTVFSVLMLTFIVFILMQLLPGDPVAGLFGNMPSTRAEYDRSHENSGWIGQCLCSTCTVGQSPSRRLGRSITERRQVSEMIVRSLPITLQLSGLAVCRCCSGWYPAWNNRCHIGGVVRLDTVITTLANLAMGIPAFWLGIMLIYLVAFRLQWLPISGYTSPFDDFWLHIRQMILPVITLSFSFIAFIARQMRSGMLEVIHQDYIRTAWSKGLSERIVVTRHAVRNALIPVVTTLGVTLGHLIGGTVLIETVFNIPGMGQADSAEHHAKRIFCYAGQYPSLGPHRGNVKSICRYFISLVGSEDPA